MISIQQIIFFIVFCTAAFFFLRRIFRIRKNILSGKDEKRNDQIGRRWRSMLLVAFGQKKMFKRPIPAFLHLLIYVGFIVINIEGIEFFLDGLTGQHRTIARFLQAHDLTGFYTSALNIFEFLAVAVIISCVFFLIRRNVLKVRRFSGKEMTQWPKLDGNLILIFEIILMFAIISMNASDQILQERNVAGFPKTGMMVFSEIFVAPFYRSWSTETLLAVERLAWWAHIIGIFAFAIYVTYSKHLHTFMAFPNTYFAKLEPIGKIKNMPEVTREVSTMMGIASEENPPAEGTISTLGAKDVTDLTWKNLLDAYTCTECGRCTAQCPANQTGKLLSPRKIMMDTRDRLEEVGSIRANSDSNTGNTKSLLGDYITKEEIFACTTCNACIEACPVLIDPVSIIISLRRYLSMEESSAPSDWNAMFSNIETGFSPWKFPVSDRFKWAEELNKEE